MIYQNKFLLATLFLVICCLWLYIIMTSGSIQLGENSIAAVKQESRHKKQNSRLDNSFPIRQSYSPSAFVARAKRQAKESLEKTSGLLPSLEIRKSSQQILFSPPTPSSFYGPPDSINSFPLSPGQLLSPLNYMQSPGGAVLPLTPAPFLPFQQQQQQPIMDSAVGLNGAPLPAGQQPMFLLSQWNAPQLAHAAPLYCVHIPVPPTYHFPEVPAVTDFNRMTSAVSKEKTELERISTEEYFDDPCEPPMFSCEDGSHCLNPDLVCDRYVHCADASDEYYCPGFCKKRIGQERLCDNYLDCPYGEDELGCFGCSNNTFSCNDPGDSGNSSCVSLKQRCDGSSQCANGVDEANCNILTESYSGSVELFPVGHSSGFLRRNLRGRWYPVCGYAHSWAKEACELELGIQSEHPIIEMMTIPKNGTAGPFLTPDGLTYKRVKECPTQLTYVHCPSVYAGTRFSTNSASAEPVLGAAKAPSSNREPLVGIVGGHDSQPRAWPFVVAINRNGRFHCGGAVLSELWVLSAAHCFPDFQHHYYQIEAGMLRRLSFSPTHQTRRLDAVVIHENYDPMVLRNDIALGLLDEPLAFNSWVRPIRLPKQESGFFGWMQQQPSPGEMCTAVGWGATREGGPDPDHLKEVEIPIVNCRHLEDRNRAEICAGFQQGGRDACQGDSGGPLMCRVSASSNAEWYIGGIVSHGVGCGRRNEPGAYTKVSHFVNWIRSVTDSRQASSSLSRTRATCPGFQCKKPYAKCLPRELHCDRVVDCLEAEDEKHCPIVDWSAGRGKQVGRSPNRKMKEMSRTSERTGRPIIGRK